MTSSLSLRWSLAFAFVFVGLLTSCRQSEPSKTADAVVADDSAKLALEARADGESALARQAGKAAFELFVKADRLKPGSVGAKRWKDTGDLLAAATDGHGRNAMAMQAYARAIEADPRIRGARLGQAKLLLRQEDSDLKAALGLLDEEEALGDVDPAVLALRRQVKQSIDTARGQAEQREQEHERGTQALAAEEAQRKQVHDARLQAIHAQSLEVGGVFCQLEGYRNFGKEFGHELNPSVAAGTFVGVLLQCLNRNTTSRYFPAAAVAIVDSSGRRFAIDASSSFDLAVWKSDRDIQNPEGLQLHPGNPRWVQLMFDLPEDVAASPTTRLAIGSKTVRLDEAMASGETP